MNIESNSIVFIPLNKLSPSAQNVRKTRRQEDIPALAASILAHGLMQNLGVVERGDGKFEVSAGGRRHAALKLLAKNGDIAKDFAVPCKPTPPEIAQETSLAENVQRVTMDVMDEVEAFAALVESGLTWEDIARRFGCTLRHVEQRLALARLSPKIRAAYRKGDINLDVARAFCLGADHAAQERVFKQMAKPITHAASVRRALTQGRVPADDRIVKFVGLEAYGAAGGRIVRDLFEPDAIFLDDSDLLHRLASDALETLRQNLLAEGWSWVEILHGHGAVEGCGSERLRPMQRKPSAKEAKAIAALEADIEALDAQLENDDANDALWEKRQHAEARWDALQQALTSWDVAEMALAGASVGLDPSGAPIITRGLIKRADLKALNKLRRAPDARADDSVETNTEAPTPNTRLSQILTEQLSRIRTCALRAEIAQDPTTALALVVHALLSQSQRRGAVAGLRIASTPCALDDLPTFTKARLDLDQRAPANLTELCRASMDDLQSWLAILIAETLNLTHRGANPADSQVQASADSLAAVLDLKMKDYWAPDEDFWLQAPKALVLEALADAPKQAMMDGKKRDSAMAALAKMKKAELAKIANAELGDSGWLPDMLITPPRQGEFMITPEGQAELGAEAAA